MKVRCALVATPHCPQRHFVRIPVLSETDSVDCDGPPMTRWSLVGHSHRKKEICLFSRCLPQLSIPKFLWNLDYKRFVDAVHALTRTTMHVEVTTSS